MCSLNLRCFLFSTIICSLFIFSSLLSSAQHVLRRHSAIPSSLLPHRFCLCHKCFPSFSRSPVYPVSSSPMYSSNRSPKHRYRCRPLDSPTTFPPTILATPRFGMRFYLSFSQFCRRLDLSFCRFDMRSISFYHCVLPLAYLLDSLFIYPRLPNVLLRKTYLRLHFQCRRSEKVPRPAIYFRPTLFDCFPHDFRLVWLRR